MGQLTSFRARKEVVSVCRFRGRMESQQELSMNKKVAMLNGRTPNPYLPSLTNPPNMALPGFGYASNTFPMPMPTPAMHPTSGIRIELEKTELWREFQEHTTEMVVTRVGRRMFPSLRFRVTGLDPTATYGFYMVFTPLDTFRYKFQHGKWNATVFDDLSNTSRSVSTYQHPDSPAPGRMWMSQPLSFHRIKLTNSPKVQGDMVLLNSMRKYQPRLVAVKLHQNFNGQPVQIVAEFASPEIQFIAVTAYQNEKITKLKVQHNPFAKGFRQNGDRPAIESEQVETSEEDRKRKESPVGLDLSSKRVNVGQATFEASRETSPTPAYGSGNQDMWSSVSNPMQAFYLEMAKATSVSNGFYHRPLLNHPMPAFYSPILAPPRPYSMLMNPISFQDPRLPGNATWQNMATGSSGSFGGLDLGMRFSMY